MVSPARKRTISLLTNPFILAAIPTFAIVLAIPVINQPYLLDIITTARVPENNFWSYHDLDGDGNSERITAFNYPNGSGITISRGGLILNQWNVAGVFEFSGNSAIVIPADCNGDGLKEVYFFTLDGDSILLHSVPDPSAPEMGIMNRLTDIAGPGTKAPDPRIVEAEPRDLDGDSKVELIFGITSGFSKYPKKIYAYYPARDSLASSPSLGGFILSIVQKDLDGDGYSEIIPEVYASGNIDPSEMKYHDNSAWLTVLDRNLEYMFEPREYRGNLVYLAPMVNESPGEPVHDILVCSMEKDSLAWLSSFNLSGETTGRTTISAMPYVGILTENKRKEPVYAVLERDRGIVLFNRHREYMREIGIQGSPAMMQKDVDLDGADEILVSNPEAGRFYVYRAGVRQPAVADLGSNYNGKQLLSIIRTRNKPPRIFIQTGTNQFWLEYRRNQLYFLSFLLHPVIYAAFIAFVLLIQHAQKRVMARKDEEKRKISELQLALIRNQLDPHFTLNALNSVLHLVEHSDREKARESLLRFSGLYRDLLLSAGKSRRTLGEELEFCHEYLTLEKVRYGNRFEFVFNRPPEINYELPVPKLVIQLFAENAVKHGIATLESGGLLSITVTGKGNELSVVIKDNGIGRARAAGEHTWSTGKGMKLMSELFDLCNNYFDESYSYTVSDLSDGDGKPAGTLVAITIGYRHEPVLLS